MNRPTATRTRLRSVARLTFGNPVSLVYLTVVAATAVFVTVDTLFVPHDDASLAGVWLFLLAAPTVFLFFIGGAWWGAEAAGPSWFMYLALTVSVLVQALALGWFTRLIRNGGSRRSPRPHGA